MYILGLSGGYFHDSAACLVKNGKVEFFIEEERLLGIKHAFDKLPDMSIRRCLDHSGIKLEDIDKIVLSWNPLYPDEPDPLRLGDKLRTIFPKEKWGNIKLDLSVVDHHLSHASSAYRTSGFKEALTFCFDGSGDGIATSVYLGQNGKLSLLEALDETQSLGWFYQRIAQFIGIGSWYHAGKTMALAAYGEPRFKFDFLEVNKEGYQFQYPDEFNKLTKVSATSEKWNESFYSHQKLFLHNYFLKFMSSSPSLSRYDWLTGQKIYIPPVKAALDLAASAQAYLQSAMLSVVKKYNSLYPKLPICFAGGVSLNCKAIGYIQEQIKDLRGLYVPPFCSDVGGAIGAALEVNSIINNDYNTAKINDAYLGCGYEDNQIESILKSLGIKYEKLSSPSNAAADAIASNKIIGWFQGRMEIGQRALGNRSILCNPNSVALKNQVNKNVKNREIWRPFSPSVSNKKILKEYWKSDADFSKYMTTAYSIREETNITNIEGVIHVDNTSRIQHVFKDTNERYYDLIESLGVTNGLPIVLNTSLNLSEMPIARTPTDALRVLYGSQLDKLFIGNLVISK